MSAKYWILGTQYDLHDADDRTKVLDLIEDNSKREAINNQTMVALVLMQDVEWRYGP